VVALLDGGSGHLGGITGAGGLGKLTADAQLGQTVAQLGLHIASSAAPGCRIEDIVVHLADFGGVYFWLGGAASGLWPSHQAGAAKDATRSDGQVAAGDVAAHLPGGCHG